ncbi:MAG: rod shape-determining protein RodA [Pseudomonadota bacterium]
MEHRASKFNWPLLVITLAILFIGLINLYSAVYYWGEGKEAAIFISQFIWIGIGLTFMGVAIFTNYRFYHRAAFYIYILINLLLVIALLFGKAIKGTSGWIHIGSFSFQPTEFAKLAFIIALAKYYSEHPSLEGFSLKDLIKPFLLMLLPFCLIVLQGDMGSSLFFILIFATLALFVKIKRYSLILLLAVGLVAGGLVYQFGLKDYQRSRILNFVHPEQDVRGSGYHLVQSKIAVGSGMFWGKGYLKGNINKLRYLPERHTDFIFPVFAEEWGFLGCLVVLFLFAALLLVGVEVASRARDRFGMILATGIVAMMFWQIVINLGGVLGLMPLTGVTLPLMSYGGSSMMVVLIALGMLENISRRRFMF